ncbi:hypothetical protein K9692_004719 [Escherichia coli]|uniref:hypothetical protein n=1 Tax=Buttiauxella gaviniae TaxID=82990 RepID=UPI001E01381A|nr:hypothetical protein [Escherichia coli]
MHNPDNEHIHQPLTVAIYNQRHANISDAENAGELFSVDIEYPMTLNDLTLLCEAVATALGVPGGVKYQFVDQPETVEEDDF